jgi:transcriptional regulator with XRE-family HTH domain
MSDVKYTHPLGAKIRKFRKLKGFTQKQLGEMCGFNESTIRNYELGNRYPDEEALTTIADALGIDRFAIADPDPSDVYGMLQILFEAESRYGLSPQTVDGEVHLVVKPLHDDASVEEKLGAAQLKEGLGIWNHINSIYEDGNLLDEEYDDWKSRYPDFLKPDDLYGYTESPEAENEINELTSQLPPHDESVRKRPRKTRISK